MQIRVHSKRAPYIRGGVRFGREAQDLDTEGLTEEQVAALYDDPNLVVQELEGAPSTVEEATPGPGINEDLVVAIAQLPDDGWTQGGKPDAAALGKVAGVEVSAADRDAAWAEYQRRQSEADG